MLDKHLRINEWSNVAPLNQSCQRGTRVSAETAIYRGERILLSPETICTQNTSRGRACGQSRMIGTRCSHLENIAAESTSLPLELHFKLVCESCTSLNYLRSMSYWVKLWQSRREANWLVNNLLLCFTWQILLKWTQLMTISPDMALLMESSFTNVRLSFDLR